MRISRRPSGFWHVEVPGWKLSVKLTRARWGCHRMAPGAWSFGLPFATGNVIRLRRR